MLNLFSVQPSLSLPRNHFLTFKCELNHFAWTFFSKAEKRMGNTHPKDLGKDKCVGLDLQHLLDENI